MTTFSAADLRTEPLIGSPEYYANALPRTVDTMRERGQRYREAEKTVMSDRSLSEDGKRAQVRTLRAAAEADMVAIFNDAKNSHKWGVETAEAAIARMPAPVVEPITLAAAAQRVQGLLDRKVPPSNIVDRAVELGDYSILQSLRQELSWMDLEQGHELRPTYDAILAKIDDAELNFLTPAAQAPRMALRRLQSDWPKVSYFLAEEIRALTTGGTGIASAMASAMSMPNLGR